MAINIGIIGGGPTGISMVIHLFRTISNANIILFDINENLGKGNSFNTCSKSLLLNTSLECTSIFYNDRTHFYNWLTFNKKNIRNTLHKNSFVPREYAAEYLLDTFKTNYTKAKQNGITYSHQQTFLREHISGNLFQDTSGNYFEFSHLILCTGYCGLKGITANKKSIFSSLGRNPNYIDISFIKKGLPINRNDKVLIIGSKLSAVDCIILLENQNHQGPISMVSTSGELPSVRNGMSIDYVPKYLSLNKFRGVFEVNRKRISLYLIKKYLILELRVLYKTEADLTKIFVTSTNPRERLNEDISNCTRGVNKWEHIISHLLDILTHYWNELPQVDRNIIITKYKKFISRYISAMPLTNALVLKGLFDNKQLNLYKYRVTSSIQTDKGFMITVNGTIHQYDVIVDATGDFPVKIETLTLIESLKSSNLMQHDPCTAIKVDSTFSVSKNKGVDIYAIGPSIHGNTIIDNYFLESSRQAEIVSGEIKKSIVSYANNN